MVGCGSGAAFVQVSQGYVAFEDGRPYPVTFVAGNQRFDFTLTAHHGLHDRPDDKIFAIKAAIPIGALSNLSRAMQAAARARGGVHVLSSGAGVDFTVPPDGFPQALAWLRKYAKTCPIGP